MEKKRFVRVCWLELFFSHFWYKNSLKHQICVYLKELTNLCYDMLPKNQCLFLSLLCFLLRSLSFVLHIQTVKNSRVMDTARSGKNSQQKQSFNLVEGPVFKILPINQSLGVFLIREIFHTENIKIYVILLAK